ncbi:leucyl aminopeptidase [Sanguibacter gelidistatuariae]|uniref:Probable cytosol aminopeptidase n=1 Tax=Sanguibacter gelidistatuariae TaxID=1814289 RepID=A0A1G6R8M8_9MICO|nr:leucyl aminopeptidase [Sanguibacter gelidistatuariae]SDD00979.1 leucyl aminopeptidase [Sanguibacter gelidistatuariae]
MADLSFTSKDLSSLTTDALVIGVVQTPAGPALSPSDALPEAVRKNIDLTLLGVSGAPDTVTRIPGGTGLGAKIIVLTGLGAVASLTPEALRRAAGAATRTLGGVASAVIALPAGEEHDVAAVAEGALLGAYAFRTYRTGEAATAGTPLTSITISTPLAGQARVKAAGERARVVADAVHATRDLVNTAPNDLFPAAFAEIAKTAAKGTSIKVTVLDEKALTAGGYGGLLGVGLGSTRGPRLVKLSYTPARPAAKIALVGKGITFDSGGISIKPAKGMEAMKSDMAGAAAVLHTVLAAAKLGLPVAVTGWLCLAENMPSGTAQRPSDVITVRGGTTVEVLNTDAEGRLVLADGLVAAGEENPDVILDIATLTGAQMVALGTRVSAVMGSDDVRAAVTAAAGESGEQFWPMPLPTELRASMDSAVADIANIGDRFGGMLVAGLFLKEFTGSTPWAHLDIAGPSFNEGSAHGYTPVGGTGVGVRTMLSYLETFTKKK